jgi:hypothetical protein
MLFLNMVCLTVVSPLFSNIVRLIMEIRKSPVTNGMEFNTDFGLAIDFFLLQGHAIDFGLAIILQDLDGRPAAEERRFRVTCVIPGI